MFEFFKVGGCVRDEIMGVKSKDIDYTVVYKRELFDEINKPTAGEAFNLMERFLLDKGYHIWLSIPDCFTIRAKFPEDHINKGMTADFVLARKELGYISGTRRPMVTIGTLMDDLERRDFTMNAIAQAEDGTLIDPFDGQGDILRRTIKTPLDPFVTLDDDPLRILRAFRFAITKRFTCCSDLQDAMFKYDYATKMPVVSEERIREELFKCFKHDTYKTIRLFEIFRELRFYVFHNTKLWLKLTNEA